MIERVVVRKGAYHDSAFLMRVARELRGIPSVGEAVVLMGTPMNRELLAGAGFKGRALDGIGPMDLVIALRAEDEGALERCEGALAALLEGGEARRAERGGRRRYADVEEALGEHPEANLVSVSVPGAYAAFVAGRALDRGRHVFLFSNNVSLEDEIALKRRARALGLLVMGPDCGTAIVAGVGLGFANRVPRGRVGLAGASGTGIQEVSSALARAGEGVSHAIGTGSRDLSREVGGLMTEFALGLLAADPGTRVITLVAKHPPEEVAERIGGVLDGLGKPAVVRYLGRPARAARGSVFYASTLDEAAAAAAALARERPPPRPGAGAEDEALARARAILGGQPKAEGRLMGLFGGGSLASEAKLILERHGIEATEPDRPLKTEGPIEFEGHLIVDTGEDFYTLGKPHPMVDQTVRLALIRKAGADPSVGVVLLDLVLGDGSHPDPAPEIAEAVAAARKLREGRPLLAVASVTGTDADPQDASRQRGALAAAGVEVEPSAARAALLAAALLGGRAEGRAP